jgi:hemolysin III
MMLLYGASSLYHAAKDENLKKKLKIFDHCAIFILIAGTYTPFLLVGLRGAWGWSLFGVIWGLAIAGILFKLFFTGRFKLVSTLLYIGMGWLVVIAARPMSQRLSPITIIFLAAGGVAYTLGTVFYLNKKIHYAHAIWHLFVVLGTVSHGAAVATLL